MGYAGFYVETPRMRRLPGGHYQRLAEGNQLPLYELLCCSCCQPAREYELVQETPRAAVLHRPFVKGRSTREVVKQKSRKAKGDSFPGEPEEQPLQRTLSWADTRGSSAISMDAPTEAGGSHGSRRGHQHSRSSSSVFDTPAQSPPHPSPSVTPVEATPRMGQIIRQSEPQTVPQIQPLGSRRQAAKLEPQGAGREEDNSTMPQPDVGATSTEGERHSTLLEPPLGRGSSRMVDALERGSSRAVGAPERGTSRISENGKPARRSSSMQTLDRESSGSKSRGSEGGDSQASIEKQPDGLAKQQSEMQPAESATPDVPVAKKIRVDVSSITGQLNIPGERPEIFLLCGYISDSLIDLLNHTRHRSPPMALSPSAKAGEYSVDIPVAHSFIIPLKEEAVGVRVTLVLAQELEETVKGRRKMSWRLNDIGSVTISATELRQPKSLDWAVYPVTLVANFAQSCSASMKCKFSSFLGNEGPSLPDDLIEPYKPPRSISKIRNLRDEAQHEAAAPMVEYRKARLGMSPESSSISSSEFFYDMQHSYSSDLCSIAPSTLPSLQINGSPVPKEPRSVLKLNLAEMRPLYSKPSSNYRLEDAQDKTGAAAVYASEDGHVVDCRGLLKKTLSLDCSVTPSGKLVHKWQLQHRQASLILKQLLQHDSEKQQQLQVTTGAGNERSSLDRTARYSNKQASPLPPIPKRNDTAYGGFRRNTTAPDRDDGASRIKSKRVVFIAPSCNASPPWSGVCSTTSNSSNNSPRSVAATPRSRKSLIYTYQEADSHKTCISGYDVGEITAKGNSALPKAISPPLKKAPPQMMPRISEQQQQPQEPPQNSITGDGSVQHLSAVISDLIQEVNTNTARLQLRMQQEGQCLRYQRKQKLQLQRDLPAVPKANKS
ncbi:hypothetical protein cyc_08352 [Cyclospora cayetanensis]|uniref:Uncharacterized protein n=1 Tax=Cyclospora cayetanensis TaxID=88456 RepID=A0A1D3D2D1_9EIME|nr:hypothetical protein cyc_08352 [Cyclospora cayetanensis]